MKPLKLFLIVLTVGLIYSCGGPPPEDLSPDMFAGISFRSVGPGTYAGRISEILVDPRDDSTIYISASTGGIFKSENLGLSWTPVFDKAGTSLSIGDMDLSISNPDLIWAGTGEASGEQNPASLGDGIYKSSDGGSSWTNMGLTETRHFSKVVIHPLNDSIVYAGATGGRWGADKHRGLYRTTDGGNTWENVLFINDNTGISDIAVHPDGQTILASAWEQRRSAWAHVKTGPNSALYRSEDGGTNWEKIESGLPSDEAGRIALAIAPGNPDVVYACYEHDSLGLFRSDDRGISWQNVNNLVYTSYWYGRIYVDPIDENHVYVMGTFIQESLDGGKNFAPIRPGRGVHVDHHVLWIDPENTDNKLLGNDGGFYITENDGESWEFISNLPIGQYYDISVDDRNPYWIYGGLQDNGVWGGPSRSENGRPVSNGDMVSINGGDGFHSDSEPNDQTIVYGESQYGWMVRYDHKTKERKRIKPSPAEGDDEYRFNWNTPFFISDHPPHELYAGAQKVLKSNDRGENWTEISNDLTGFFKLDTIKVIGQKPSFKPYFTITALAESPIKKGLLYAGTDDGRLFITRDDGVSWINLTDSIPAPADRFFSRIIASNHIEGRVYIGFGRFYEADDLSPYIFVSDDYGSTWRDISSNMPEKAVIRSVCEHPSNPNLLFAGTHNSLLISLNCGQTWIRPETNLPYVGIDDIVIQERENDLVLGSYGRGIWILDNVSFLSELSIDMLGEEHILFEPKSIESNICPDSLLSHKKYDFIAPEPESGIMISYYLNKSYKQGSKKKPVITVREQNGDSYEIKDMSLDFGFNSFIWSPKKPGLYEIVISSPGKESVRIIEI